MCSCVTSLLQYLRPKTKLLICFLSLRCIKPNAQMQTGVFHNGYVVDQLRALGILQACEVLKICLPTRITYADLTTALGEIVKVRV